MAALAPVLPALKVVSTIASIASVASSLISGQAEAQTYYGQAAASDFNAKVNEQDASIAASQTKAELEKADRERRIRIGQNIARAGGSGAGISSIQDTVADNAVQDELNMLTIKYQDILNRRALLNDAQLDRLNASGARQSAKYATGASILKGTATLGSIAADRLSSSSIVKDSAGRKVGTYRRSAF